MCPIAVSVTVYRCVLLLLVLLYTGATGMLPVTVYRSYRYASCYCIQVLQVCLLLPLQVCPIAVGVTVYRCYRYTSCYHYGCVKGMPHVTVYRCYRYASCYHYWCAVLLLVLLHTGATGMPPTTITGVLKVCLMLLVSYRYVSVY